MAKHTLKYTMTDIPIDSGKLDGCKSPGVEVKNKVFYMRGTKRTNVVKQATIEVSAQGENEVDARNRADRKLSVFLTNAKRKKLSAGDLQGLS